MKHQRGFTYLWLLFAIAIAGAAAAALGQRWTTILQREREAELAYRGQAIADAIASYRQAGGQWPKALAELVDDRRAPKPMHHLRQLYADPFTRRADWTLIDDGKGGIRGVRSNGCSFIANAALPASAAEPTDPFGSSADHPFPN